jgi:predicted AlkP superfamily pyrophosphatase or phosphodiesterase
MDALIPEAEGASITGIVPALLRGDHPAWFPDGLRDARSVVLLVIDGLGWNLLSERSSGLPNIGSMSGAPITTVIPSSTAPALTSLTTGTPPSVHGILGTRMQVGGKVLDVLRWTVREGEPPDPRTVQPIPPFQGRPVPVVTRALFRGSGFTETHLRDAEFVGWWTAATLVEHCRTLISEHAFVYAYYEGLDLVAHVYGTASPHYAAELRAVDRLVEDLLDVLPATAQLLITSDHGMVPILDEGVVALDTLDGALAGTSGEPRFRWLHAVPGAESELLSAADEKYGNGAWVLSRERVVEEEWLGPPPEPRVRKRLGDVVLAAREPVAFIDPVVPREGMLLAHHGSITEEEMLVPLLCGQGRA